MNQLEEAALRTNLIPSVEKARSFLADLKKVPDFRWLINKPNRTEERLQGDLHKDFPVAFIDSKGEVLSKKFPVLIINNTCDLQPRRSMFVTVAPLLDFKSFVSVEIQKRGEQKARALLHSIRLNDPFDILWLPPFGEFEEGAIVYLDRLSSVSATIFERSVSEGQRLASFTQNGFYYFLIKLTNYLARAESHDVSRSELRSS